MLWLPLQNLTTTGGAHCFFCGASRCACVRSSSGALHLPRRYNTSRNIRAPRPSTRRHTLHVAALTRRHVVTVAGCGASDHYSLDASSIQSQVESLTTVSTRPPHWPLNLVNRASLHHCPYNCVAGHFGISAPIGWTLRAVHPLQLTVSLLYTSTTSTSFRSIRRGPPHWTLFSVF